MTRVPPLVFLVLFSLATAVSAQEPVEQTLGLSPISFDSAVRAGDIDALHRAGIEPEGAAYEVAGPENLTVAVFRDHLDARILLYRMPGSDVSVFARVGTNDRGQPELRIWSDGPSEIVVDADGMQIDAQPSAGSFRFRAANDAMSVSDTIACIARELGLTMTRSTLERELSRAACTATNRITLVLTATNCLSMASVGSANVFATIGCVNGIAKIIACGVARCR